MPAAPRCEFLDWKAPFLPRVADWLLAERPDHDFTGLVVALPGSRAARALVGHLARKAGPELVPPRVVTQGELVDALVRVDRPVAGRLARTLAWAQALRALAPEDLEALVAAAPASPAEWLRLAEVVRTLHGELAPEGLAFADVARSAEVRAIEGEARRWDALARAQERWNGLLDAAGVADPHAARRAAIEAGAVDRSLRVVLAGVADMNRLLRRLLQELGDVATALVFAPKALAAGFDALGALVAAQWTERELLVELERWHVADRPQEQAAAAVRCLSRWNGRFTAADVAVGVADEEVVPALERAFSEHGVLARPAGGTPLAATRPARLLAGVQELLARPSFAAFAALVRQPDFESAVWRAAGERFPPPAALLDEYQAEHLPRVLPERWLARPRPPEKKPDPLPGLLGTLERCAREQLGALWSDERRPLAAWAPAVRALLAAVFDWDLRPERRDEDRVVVEALKALERAREELEDVPAGLAPERVGAAEALEVLLAGCASAAVPPRPAGPDETALDLVGWLDLALDDARAVVVTGFNAGKVPRSPGHDPFLPEALRARLALPGDAERLARDVYAASALRASRAELAFVSGRRTRAGEPLLPSRLVFHRPEAELPGRVRHFFEAGTAAWTEAQRDERQRVLPRRAGAELPRSLSVTAYRDYLASPYLFYLRHVLGLETIDDRALELDGRTFGILAHDVLADLGRDAKARELSDASEIATFLKERLAQRAAGRFGRGAQPAVELQVERLERRFELFAEEQAARRAEGWRVHAVEWSPTAEVTIAGSKGGSVALTGRIDRIDVRTVDGRKEWAILDYKTGDEPDAPEKAHRTRDGAWIDLQLPLYTLLARELGLGSAVQLGYFALGATAEDTGVRLAAWTPADVASALTTAAAVVDGVCAGAFFEEGPRFRAEPVFEAILGRGLLLSTADDGPGAENGGAGNGDGGGA